MATKRLIDANAFEKSIQLSIDSWGRDCNSNAPTIVRTYKDVLSRIGYAPTVDAVEVAGMKEFAEDVVYQFGCYCQKNGRLHITHGGLSTLEHAFDILGWENPHPVPECECQIKGCHEHATCGTPTADGYKRMCGKHMSKHCAKMDGDWNG